MVKFLSKVFKWLGSFLLTLASKLQKRALSLREKNAINWHRDRGDSSLRLHYQLDSESVVLDCGGYEGQWSSDIYSMYQSKIIIFEPVLSYYKNIKKRFSANNDIEVLNLGIGGQTETLNISISGNTSSVHLNSDEGETIKVQSFKDFVNSKGIKEIHLMKINIEGAEYDLLDHILKHDMQSMVKNFQIQFHDFCDDFENRMMQIQQKLVITHQLTYQYPLIWENWERKD